MVWVMLDQATWMLIFAALASMAMMPVAVVALVFGMRRIDRLMERNAAQAVTIAGLQRRLERVQSPRAIPEPPRGPWHERRFTPENPAAGRDYYTGLGVSTSQAPARAVRPIFTGGTIPVPTRDYAPIADGDICVQCLSQRRDGCGCGAEWLR